MGFASFFREGRKKKDGDECESVAFQQLPHIKSLVTMSIAE
jgi:hypothetical protein